MRRADRLFQIVQLLRGKRAVTARRLAERLDVSVRTIYRDMQDLSLSGVPILGEAGSGYRLLPGFDLPPLMFDIEELSALVLGARMVRAWSDPSLSAAAQQALDKIEAVAKKIYGASAVAMEGKIRRRIRRLEKRGFGDLPICIAKTQSSLSDDAELLGRPEDFTLIVTDAAVCSGAGFVVVYCGDIMTMPGLPKVPSAERIDVTEDGEITGLS